MSKNNTTNPRQPLIQADIVSMHATLDEIASDNSLDSDVRDAIDALRIALDSGDLREETVAEMLNAFEPE